MYESEKSAHLLLARYPSARSAKVRCRRNLKASVQWEPVLSWQAFRPSALASEKKLLIIQIIKSNQIIDAAIATRWRSFCFMNALKMLSTTLTLNGVLMKQIILVRMGVTS